MLKRERDNIRELHDAEPDSKWCMNSLAHYLLLSAKLPSTPPADVAKFHTEAKIILERLAVIDEDRKERYRELGKSSNSSNLTLSEPAVVKQYSPSKAMSSPMHTSSGIACQPSQHTFLQLNYWVGKKLGDLFSTWLPCKPQRCELFGTRSE